MPRPYKTTGCFRFFLFLIILAPLAYIGASYYHGQDGIGNIVNLFKKGLSVFSSSDSKKSSETTTSLPVESPGAREGEKIKQSDLENSLEIKDRQIESLIKENLELKQKLKEYEEAAKKTPNK
ncbi:MAG TPA: hypothetical protein PKM27_12240 [Saprospiraceae bacterium]|nr:hypothetical protein [Saprospiraceae bacterium]HNT21726.1 hypothetical protein [Saprospiraceae bacterium]